MMTFIGNEIYSSIAFNNKWWRFGILCSDLMNDASFVHNFIYLWYAIESVNNKDRQTNKQKILLTTMKYRVMTKDKA